MNNTVIQNQKVSIDAAHVTVGFNEYPIRNISAVLLSTKEAKVLIWLGRVMFFLLSAFMLWLYDAHTADCHRIYSGSPDEIEKIEMCLERLWVYSSTTMPVLMPLLLLGTPLYAFLISRIAKMRLSFNSGSFLGFGAVLSVNTLTFSEAFRALFFAFKIDEAVQEKIKPLTDVRQQIKEAIHTLQHTK
jgi:hypothetical protein